jgi:hypothetical protein
MSLLGIKLTLLIGKEVPTPAPPGIINALQSIEVTNSDQEQDGFELTLSIGRNSSAEAAEYALLGNPLLNQFNRVIIMVNFGVSPEVLIDGVITFHQFNPSQEPGKSTLTIIGEGLSVMMDIEEKSETFPNQSDTDIVNRILGDYSRYGLSAKVIEPQSMVRPREENVVTSQQKTDLTHIRALAEKYGHVFYIEPTDEPKHSIAYWGPPKQSGIAQKALTFNMGEFSNIEALNFQTNALKQTKIEGHIQDPTNSSHSELKLKLNHHLTFAAKNSDVLSGGKTKTLRYRDSGLSVEEMRVKAQKLMDDSSDVVLVSGELDSMRYGEILRARHTVVLRGVGESYNGLYHVKTVTHTIRRGLYKQKFILSREGLGTTVTKVSK